MRRSIGLLILLLSFGVAGVASAEDFIVSDIRLEGLQRIPAGSVFAALPINVGARATTASLQHAMRELFRTGNFNDVQVGRDGNVLVITVQERPSIAEINIEGNKAIETDALMKGLKSAGLAEGQVFKRSTLDGISLELQRQYVAQGRYDATIDAEIEELPRNRVEVNITIDEGTVAKIKHINIVGNEKFDSDELLDLFQLRSTGMWSWISGNDKYSKEKLKGDLEKLESFYLDRGHLKFNVESTQVAISPTRDSVYITINIVEGDVYKVSDITLAGDIIVDEQEMRSLVQLKPGKRFSQALVTSTEEAMTRRLGNEGYTFAKVNSIPEINDQDKTVAMKFFVDPGKRTYVRRIEYKGNTKTVDEVLRREMRQMEGAPAAAHKIEQSRLRLERLGYFKEVKVETPEVPTEDDMVDVIYTVEEQHSGSIGASIGYADDAGVVLGATVQQNNFMGTGRQVGFGINRSKYQTSYKVNYLNPYYTKDGVSRGFSVYYRETDYSEFGEFVPYSTNVYGGTMSFGYPLSETERLGFSIGASHTEIDPGFNTAQEIVSTPFFYQGYDSYYLGGRNSSGSIVADTSSSHPLSEIEGRIANQSRKEGFIDLYGDTFTNYSFTLSWLQSKLNRGRMPTAGSSQSVSLETSLPGSDLLYYKLRYEGQILFPLTEDQNTAVRLHTSLGYGEGWGDTEHLPFFENFMSGGFGSVRGYESRSLGPRSTRATPYYLVNGHYVYNPRTQSLETISYGNDFDAFGGNILVEGGVELIFPLWFVKDQRSLRTALFIDAGNVFDSNCGSRGETEWGKDFCSDLDFGELRYSAGFGLTWITAMGPLTFSLAKPFHYGEFDERKVFQFSLGTGF
jgi:outer membrane protein insertion porin family